MSCTCTINAEVKITAFANPHLFWFFENKNALERSNLESKLGETSHAAIRRPQLEQCVLVYDASYKRAVIKDISPPNTYYCWLIDYGILYCTHKVYEMPGDLFTLTPMVKKAALINVVGVEEILDPMEKSLIESLHFTPGTIHRARKHIKSASAIYFECVNELDGIHKGALHIHGCNGVQYDLSAVMIKEKLLAFNEAMFAQSLAVNSNDDNDNYLKYACNISTQDSSEVQSYNEDFFPSVTSRSIGRAIKTSPNELSTESDKYKQNNLQKWIEDVKICTSPAVEAYESDGYIDIKTDSSVAESSKPHTDLEIVENVDSVSATIKLSPDRLAALRNLKNKHLLKNTKLFDKINGYSTDTSESELESHSNSELSGNKIKCIPSNYSSPLKDQTNLFEARSLEEVAAPAGVDDSVVPKNKVVNWGDFDGVSEKSGQHSVTRLLNIQPAGASYTIMAKTKKSLDRKDNPKAAEKFKEQCFNDPPEDASISKRDLDGDKDISDVLHKIDPNIICVCNQCKKYASDTVTNHNEHTVRQPKKLVKPPLLFKAEEDEGDEIIIKNFASTMTNRSTITTDPNIIVHGTICPKPIHSIGEVCFNPAIHRYLRAFEQVYSIQSFMWPCLLRKMNVCTVNSPKSGKTMGYLPVMCTNLLERNERYEDLPTNTVSPIVVILCPGTIVADEVYDLTVKMLDDALSRPAVALAVPPMDKTCLNQFQKHCDLLITTPIMLMNLLHSRIITVKRVCHLILEHADVLLEKFPQEMSTLFNLFNSMLKHRNCNYSLQLVALAERWTLSLENLMKSLRYSPFICIGAHLEAALYGRADIQMHFLESQVKMLTLCDLLKSSYETCRTLVVCDNDEAVHDIRETLELKGIKGTFVSSSMTKVEIEETGVKWLATVGGKHLVFVCTDEIYNTILRITNAVILIHYNLPTTWTQFSTRFSCFLQNYESPLSTTKKADWIHCKAHVFLDETSNKQFPKLMQFLTRMGCTFSTKFNDCYKESIVAREVQNISAKVALCAKLKQFGTCTNLKCRARHKLSSDLDYLNDLPKSGNVKFKILKIRSVALFTVKLLEHTDLDGNKHDCVKYPNLHKDLQKVMQLEKHSVYDTKVNMRYVYHSAVEGIYYRCVVKKIVHKEQITKTATVVIVKLIDVGFDSKVGVADLYEMPEEFRNIPPEGVEIYIANIVPPDSDEHFSAYSKKKISELINASLEDGKGYCFGHILLQLSNTLWIKNLYVLEQLPTLNTIATRLNLNKDLLRENIANKCDSQLVGLYNLCNNAGITLPNYTQTNNITDIVVKQATPQWAFLDESDKFTEVFISTTNNDPSLFYVRIKKFDNLLEDLEKEIKEIIAKPFYPTTFEVCVGHFYLASDGDSADFCRVQIVHINDGIAKCFYVDYGYYENVSVGTIKFLTNDFIEKLPFQAIECRLYGIQPVYDSWEPEASAIMDNYILEQGTDIFKTLYAATCKTEKCTETGDKKYAVLLIDIDGTKHNVINKLLIDCGEAVNVEGESIDIDFAISEMCANDVDDMGIKVPEEIENRELSFEDVHQMRSKHAASDNEAPVESDSADNVWDFEINNPELFLKNLLGVSQSTGQVPHLNGTYSLPQIQALPSLGYSTPSVEWFQNEKHIKLSILLPGLEKYSLHLVRNVSLVFKTFHNETDYQFHIQLFDKVKKGQESLGGLCLRVVLIKCQPSKWPRLTLSKDRLRFIKYDLKQCNEPEERKKPILSLGQVLEDGDKLPGDNIVQYGSDDDSSCGYSLSSDEF